MPRWIDGSSASAPSVAAFHSTKSGRTLVDEVIGTARSLIGQRLRLVAVDEAQHRLAIVEMAQYIADRAAQHRHDLPRQRRPIFPRRDLRAAEKSVALLLDGVQNILPDAVNDAQRVEIGLARS